jgi:hypothetical protein
VIKPKPFESLNHFTVPVAITIHPLQIWEAPKESLTVYVVCRL